MKFIIKLFSVICLCALLTGCDKFKPTKQSSDSFSSVFSPLNWDNATPNKKSLKSTCSDTLVKMAIANLPKKLPLKKDSHSFLFLILDEINSKFDDVIKTFDLENKLAEDTGIFKVTAKDKLLNAKINARNEKDFIKKVKTRRDGKYVNWGEKEKELNKALSSLYKARIAQKFEMDPTDINNCSVLFLYTFNIKELTSQKIIIAAECIMFFNCECSKEHTDKDLEKGHIVFSTYAEATFPNNTFDFNTLLFASKGKTEYRIVTADCCKKE
nr:hypothetical protein [uncultured Psychroserpens sp.]